MVREEDGEDGAASNQVLHFKSVEVGVMSRLVVVQHEVDCVCGAADEDNLECRVP